MSDDQPLPDSCPDHHPIQHRDNKPPWCRTCGLTEAGEIPEPPLRPIRRPRPVTFDRTPTQSGALIIETSGLANDDEPPSGALPAAHLTPRKPQVICLCGSTRFRAEFTDANRLLTMAGLIVVAPGVFGHDGDPLTDEQKQALDTLHLRKIDLADAIFVVNPGGYVGTSTRTEIAYAVKAGKPVTYLDGPPDA